MYSLPNVCFICLNNKDIVKFIVFQDAENQIVQQMKFVLPEIAILEPRLPLPICSTCRRSLDDFHNFKKVCLDNSCRYNDYINKLQGSNDSYKGKFGDLQINVNDNKFSINEKDEPKIDSNIEELETEEHLAGNVMSIKEEFSKSENRTDPFSEQILTNETEFNIVQNYDRNINCVDSTIRNTIQSGEQEVRISENKLPTNQEVEENIVSNNEESEDSTDLFYQQNVKKEIEFIDVQNCHNINNVDQIIKDEILSSDEEVTNKDILESEMTYLLCSVCNKKFVEKSNLHKHMMVHANVKDKKCLICGKIFKLAPSLRLHMIAHAGIKDFDCSICNKTFARKIQLTAHMIIHTDTKKFKCTICSKMYKTKSILTRHMLTHTKNYKCTICNEMFATNQLLEYHLTIHALNNICLVKDYKCAICNKMFREEQQLKDHMRTHANRKDVKCSMCDKLFATNHHLKCHMMIHEGIKNYKCSVCNKLFGRKDTLKHHMMIHSGIKNFECSVCNKLFHRKQHLKYHMMTHIDVKGYMCST